VKESPTRDSNSGESATGALQKRLLPASAVSLVTTSSLFLAPPIAALYGNAGEFLVPAGTLLGAMILPGLIFFIALGLICLLVSERIFRVLASWLFAISLLLYLQGNWLLGDYGLFDGTNIDWDRHLLQGMLEVFLWFTLPVAAVISSRRIAPHILIISAMMLSFVFVIPLVAALQIGQSGGRSKERWASRTNEMLSKQTWAEEMWQFSSGENVVFILLDAFESTDLNAIFANSPELMQSFRGFTYYRNTLGTFPTTHMSVPALLTGEIYDNGPTIREYLDKTLRKRGLPDWFADRGYRSSVLTRSLYCEYFPKSTCFSWDEYSHSDPDQFATAQTIRLLDLALFRFAPHFLKMWVYSDHRWLLQRTFNADPPGPLSQWQSVAIAKDIATHAHTETPDPVFKFLHFDIPHPPYARDASCNFLSTGNAETTAAEVEMMIRAHSRCGLTLAISILQSLKRLDVWNDATVVILSDHGQRWVSGRAKPVLMIKPRGSQGRLRFSDVPATLTDVPKSIADLLGFENDFPGEAVQALVLEVKRVRPYHDSVWAHRFYKADHLPKQTHFDVEEHVSELSLMRQERTN